MRFVCLFGCLALLASACTTFSPFNQTGEDINRSAAQYANDAVLQNIIRSEFSEPLSFITITGLDGTASASGTFGLPSVALGPHAAASPRNYVFGPNTIGRTNSNTFHVSVVDDPASFEALLTPLNPAMLALFIDQGYPRELMFFLFVSRIRQVALSSGVDDKKHPIPDQQRTVIGVKQEWANDFGEDRSNNDHPHFEVFSQRLNFFLWLGLTAQTEITSIAAGRSFPYSKICLDALLPPPDLVLQSAELPLIFVGPFTQGASVTIDKIPLLAKSGIDTCVGAEGWIRTGIVTGGQNLGTAGGPGGGGTSAGSNAATQQSSMIVGPDRAIWIYNPGNNAIIRVTTDKRGAPEAKGVTNMTTTKGKENAPLIAYLLKVPTDPKKCKDCYDYYQIFMRSTYGIYDYLGAIERYKMRNKDNEKAIGYLSIFGKNDQQMLDIDENSSRASQDCFASVIYRDGTYCVHNHADRTKRIFALLHNLQQLMTAPSNTPTTLTVTPVP